MSKWTAGYSLVQLDEAQERYGLRFPPDLIELLLDRRPVDGYDWDKEDHRIREMLNWPFELLLFDVEQGFWWPDWGERPLDPGSRREILREQLCKAPKLIPLLGHRFLPETPNVAANPVFSMHGFDTIYYGCNLEEYFTNEFEGRCEIGPVRYVPFWSDIVQNFHLAYTYYE